MKECSLEDIETNGREYKGELEKTIKYQLCPDSKNMTEN